jgi:hypothetical protein
MKKWKQVTSVEFITEALSLISKVILKGGTNGASAPCPTPAIQFTISHSLATHTYHRNTEKRNCIQGLRLLD